MSDALAKVPFFRLLLPMSLGILVQYHFSIFNGSIIFLPVGFIMMLIAYFTPPLKQYKQRWVFGAGLFLVLFCIGVVFTTLEQKHSSFNFSPQKAEYKGTITNIPQEKEKTIACDVKLTNGKDIACNFQKGIRSSVLKTGDEIIFTAKINRIKHFATSNNFDYPAYMYNKGISGSVYLFSDDWEATEEHNKSVQGFALECRQSIVNYYKTLDLDDTSFSIISALTLGYKDSLSDDIVQSFRDTGTAHILAVSGMHTGIIYGVLLGIFALFFRNVRYNRIAQLLIIIFLWGYALITGFSPSVVRACLMLSIFCLSNILGRKGFTYNNICIAAFLMLLYNPFWLFDVGFQLSFSAVISIRFFQPYLSKIVKTKNKLLKPAWNLFSLSIAAQIGTFPLCLYYFGTFPTYFFITNLLIIPLVSIIVYTALVILFIGVIAKMPFLSFIENLYYLPVKFLKVIINFMVDILRFFEQIPFAVITNIRMPLLTTISLIACVILLSISLKYKKIRLTQISLGIFIVALIFCLIPPKNALQIYQKKDGFYLSWNINHTKYEVDSINNYKFVKLGDKNLLTISNDIWKNKQTDNLFPIDYLHIVKNDSISLYSLTQKFSIGKVILDNSLSNSKRRKLITECKKLKIPYYDVSEKGLFRTNF